MADNLNQSPLAPASPSQDIGAVQGGAAVQQGSEPAAAGQAVPVGQPAVPEPVRESLPVYSNQKSGIVAQPEGGIQQPTTTPSQQSGGLPVAPGAQPAGNGQQPAQPAQPAAQAPNIPELAPVGPSFFGYKAPKWASDFEHVRSKQGKGSEHDSDTWLVTMIDRLLKKHSL